jgi:hypothetical protein
VVERCWLVASAFLVVETGKSGEVVCALQTRVLRCVNGDYESEVIEGEMIGDDHKENSGGRIEGATGAECQDYGWRLMNVMSSGVLYCLREKG